ncbi:MAG: 3-isopropylmalate dehydratase [Megasphaera sp.]|uniref:LeuD/DmdB family oxidoreductase small subunit n=1 Tax=unclassified Megasphaera TaxID=2626256 RepID=UPI003A7FA786
MEKVFQGKIWKLGDDIDTDIIIPTQWLTLNNIDDMKTHIFEPLRPELASSIQAGDILVAGKNFGCGSSREQAPEGLHALQIKCIIAKSFARIFFRNAINNGLLLIECPDLPDHCSEGDQVEVVINHCIRCRGKEYKIPQIPDYIFQIIADGGLVKSMQKKNHLQ